MLPRSHRISGAELKQTLPQSKPMRLDWGTVRIYPSKHPKVACIISKKVARSSPDRHRIKRRIYGEFEEHIAELPPAFYYIFPTRTVLTIGADRLKRAVAAFVAAINKQ